MKSLLKNPGFFQNTLPELYYHKTIFLILFLIIILISNLSSAQDLQNSTRPWKGNAILGNGRLSIVYSDDSRIKGKGIQHLYYNDFTVDYISSSYINVSDQNGYLIPSKTSVGFENFFNTLTSMEYRDNIKQEVRCFVHPQDAVIIKLSSGDKQNLSSSFNIVLRKKILTSTVTKLNSIKKDGNTTIAVWSNNTSITAASKYSDSVSVTDSSITFYKGKPDDEIIIAVGHTPEIAKAKLQNLLKRVDLFAEAKDYWENWISKGTLPKFKNSSEENKKYSEFFKRNLYSVKAANINGMIPADITGQFLTNNMPQLYPRDALMCARIFLETGHFEEAKQIISFWAKPEIPKKTKGEFYARYDAYAKAVDAGAGARYDEPEWDANGYFIQLVNAYYKEKKEWLAPKGFIYELADFLVSKVDKLGLLYEGGIVEWTGYLPATNMICAAALQTTSYMAKNDNLQNSASYSDAYRKISSSLYKLFDDKRQTYTAVRYTGIKTDDNRSIAEKKGEKLYLWDTTIPFGVLWGYENHEKVKKTIEFYEANTIAPGGGLQYFEAKDNAWLSAYGSDAFFFPTAALSEYLSIHGDPQSAKKHIDWMISNSNSYGLMPERIYLNESDCSDASPLSWCNGEFALAVLTWSRVKN